MNKISILHVKFDPITMLQALAKIEEFIKSDRFHYIVTPNPEFVVYAHRHPYFKDILNNADLSIPDGTGILWAAKKQGTPLPEKVTGTDLAINLLPIAAKKGYKLYLLGGAPGTAETAQKVIKNQYPNIKIVGAEPGPHWHINDNLNYPSEDMKQTLDRIRQSNADILLVAFGAPKQEKFISYFQKQLNVKVTIGVGGALDYISGVTPRAPFWMRRLGLEWLHRLITKPSRLPRIFRAVVIFPILILLKKS